MNPFDAFDSSSGTRAANQGYRRQKNAINDADATLQNYTDQGNSALKTGTNQAQGYLDAGQAGAGSYYDMARQLFAATQNQDQTGRTMYMNSAWS